MIKNILFIFFFVVLNSCSKKEKLHISETQSMIDDMFDEYFEAFSNKEFEKILDNIISLPKKDWENLLEKYQNKLLNYDPGNSKFKNILNKVLHI